MPDICLCLDYKECKKTTCVRHPDRYEPILYPQSWAHLFGTDYCELKENTQLVWDEAINHLNHSSAEYASNGYYGRLASLAMLKPLKERYDNGERTLTLYNEIMGC